MGTPLSWALYCLVEGVFIWILLSFLLFELAAYFVWKAKSPDITIESFRNLVGKTLYLFNRTPGWLRHRRHLKHYNIFPLGFMLVFSVLVFGLTNLRFMAMAFEKRELPPLFACGAVIMMLIVGFWDIYHRAKVLTKRK